MDITTTYTSSVARVVLSRSVAPTSVSQGRALPIVGFCATHGVTTSMKQISVKPGSMTEPAFAPGNTTLGGAVAWRERGADLRLRPRTLMV